LAETTTANAYVQKASTDKTANSEILALQAPINKFAKTVECPQVSGGIANVFVHHTCLVITAKQTQRPASLVAMEKYAKIVVKLQVMALNVTVFVSRDLLGGTVRYLQDVTVEYMELLACIMGSPVECMDIVSANVHKDIVVINVRNGIRVQPDPMVSNAIMEA